MPDTWIPKDLDEAVAALLVEIPPDQLDLFKSWEYDEALARAHSTVGRDLRNRWNLWFDGPLVSWFHTELDLTHADDMSSVLLSALWCDLRGVPRRTLATVARSQVHWEQLPKK